MQIYLMVLNNKNSDKNLIIGNIRTIDFREKPRNSETK